MTPSSSATGSTVPPDAAAETRVPSKNWSIAASTSTGLAAALLFLTAYAFSLAGLIVLFATQNPVVRWCSFILFGLTSAIDLGFLWIVKAPYNAVAAGMVLDAVRTSHELGATFSLFPVEIAAVTLMAACLTASLAELTRRLLPRLSAKYLVVPLVGVVLSAWVILRSGGAHSEVPMPFKIPLLTAYVGEAQLEIGVKEAPRLTPRTRPLIPSILYLVDESITGSALSINGYSRETTPFLAESRERFLNLGIAASGANGR